MSKGQLRKLDENIEKECAQIISPDFHSFSLMNFENDLSGAEKANSEHSIENMGKIKRILTDLQEKDAIQSRVSHFSSLNVICRAPSLSVMNAIKTKSKFVTPLLSSPLTFHTIPFIHGDSETNV